VIAGQIEADSRLTCLRFSDHRAQCDRRTNPSQGHASILTTDEERDVGCVRLDEAKVLQRPLPDDALRIVAACADRKTARRLEKSCDRCGWPRHGPQMNRDDGRSAIRGRGSRELRARASRHAASILRARADHAARRGGNEKPDLYAVASCAKVWTYNALRDTNGCKGHFRSLERFRFASGLRPEAAISQSQIRLLLFFGGLFATFLVLPSRSSLPSSFSWPCRPLVKTGSVNMHHAVYRSCKH